MVVRFEIGRWALIRGSYDGDLNPNIYEIAKVTDKLIKYAVWRNVFNQSLKTDVIATFATKDAAMQAQQAFAGIRGERDRRIQAARAAAANQAGIYIANIGGEA